MEELKKGSGIFKYVAIRNWILENIEKHTFKFGDKLPSENLLCKKFFISRQTVRNAIDELEKNGVVKRVKGSGTYVAKAHERNKTVGVLLSYLNEYIFPAVLQGVEEVLTANSFGVDLGITYNKIEGERRFLERMLSSNVSGLIVEGTKTGLPNPNLHLYKELINREIPIVFTHNYYPELENLCPKVLVNDVDCAKRMTNYLIKRGHRKIAGLFKFDDMQGQKRYLGYIQALMEADIPVDDEIIGWFSTYTQDSIFKPNNYAILENIDKYTAIFCYNDKIAANIYSYFTKRGIKVPQDISMVGFDDSTPISNMHITTLRHPKELLGKCAAQMLIKSIKNGIKCVDKSAVLMDATIIERNSVKRIN